MLDIMTEIQDLIAIEIKDSPTLCKPKSFMQVTENLSEFKHN